MQRFLVSRLSALGDVVCSLPVAGALKEGIPDCETVWVADRRFAGVVRRCKHVDTVLETDSDLSVLSKPKLEGQFEAALDLQGLLKSALIVARSKAKRKLGFHWQREAAWLFSERVLPDPSSFHVVDQYVDVARAAGGKANAADFGLEPRPEEVAAVKSKLLERGIRGGFVSINAGAGWATKRWSPESYAAVIDGLAERGFSSVLIGTRSPKDLESAETVAKNSKNQPASMLGETTTEELIALLSLCSAHLGGDTGSTHIATALGKPAVGLYSITNPLRVCPYGQAHRCLYDPEGLDRICPESALDKLLEALA